MCVSVSMWNVSHAVTWGLVTQFISEEGSIHPKVVTILVKDKENVIKKNQKKVLLLVLQFLQVSM